MRVKDREIKTDIDRQSVKRTAVKNRAGVVVKKGHKQRGRSKMVRRLLLAEYRRQIRAKRIGRMRGKAREWSPIHDMMR